MFPVPGCTDLLQDRAPVDFRDQYPRHELRPMLVAQLATFERPVMEEFGPPWNDLASSLPVPNLHETALVQVQMDRFVMNWRRSAARAPIRATRTCFSAQAQTLTKFADFLQSDSSAKSRLTSACDPREPHGTRQRIHEAVPSRLGVPRFRRVMVLRVPARTGRCSSSLADRDSGDRQAQSLGKLDAQTDPKYRRQENLPLMALNMTARIPEGTYTLGA